MGWQVVIDPEVAAGRSLLGTAVGDSLGLPYEGLATGRVLRFMPLPLRQRMLFGHGFLSDDTIQSALVLRSLIRFPDDPARFRADLAKSLRVWFLSVPPGIGLSTIKACTRLCLGSSPDRSGVRSAGNGAAMRSAVIGAFFHQDAEARMRFVEASATVTHTHPLAIQGSQLIALAAAHEVAYKRESFREEAAKLAPDWPWSLGWPERVRGPFRQCCRPHLGDCSRLRISNGDGRDARRRYGLGRCNGWRDSGFDTIGLDPRQLAALSRLAPTF